MRLLRIARATGLVVLMAGFLAGCGELAYRRGAGADDWRQAVQDCRQTALTDLQQPSQDAKGASEEACLGGKGWTVARWRGTTVERGAADTSAGSAPASESGVATPVLASRISTTTTIRTVAETDAANPKAAQINPVRGGEGHHVEGPIPILTWWKAGGFPSDLDDAARSCAERLGLPIDPDPAHRKVSLAMLTCIRDTGWHAVVADSSGMASVDSVK
jgi:hypothetical protein